MHIAKPVDGSGKVWDLDLIVCHRVTRYAGSAQQAARPNRPAADNDQDVRLGVELAEGHRREISAITSASKITDGGCSGTIC
jgi:hypothetical protein